MEKHIFAGLDGKDQPSKPRQTGLTMTTDWGMGIGAQEDFLAASGDYTDFGKICAGLSRLLSNDLLKEKIAAYQKRQVHAFPGGAYLEYAEVEGRADLYFPATVEAGYRWVEVSDNLFPATVEWKARMIRSAIDDFGLKVIAEVGKKEGLANDVPLVDNAKACLDASASIILLEAAELVADDPETAKAVDDIVKECGLERVMFELAGPWIEGVASHDIHSMRRLLIEKYGPEVNIGNVDPSDLMSLEAYRRGLGVNAGKPAD